MSILRLFAALSVAGVCGLWGFGKAAELRRETNTLSALCAVLEQLRWEITELRTPLPELIPRLADRAPGLCQSWLQALAESMTRRDGERFALLWRESVEESGLLPPGEAREALLLLGQSLGRFDAPEQGEEISRCLRTLERCGILAGETARVNGRLYSGLGLSAGALLVILLL